MNLLLVFAGITAVTFVWRFSGFTLRIAQTSPFWEQFLRFVPVSVFTALVVSALYQEPTQLTLKGVALAVAGIMAWRTHQFGLSVLAGLAILWLLVLLSVK